MGDFKIKIQTFLKTGIVPISTRLVLGALAKVSEAREVCSHPAWGSKCNRFSTAPSGIKGGIL